MKKFTLIKSFTLCMALGLFTFLALGQTATVESRPSQIDISEVTSESAVLMTLADYPLDGVRYRLYNGSNQYNPWNGTEYVTSTAYISGPNVPGTPTTSTTWWILFQRGTNNLTAASYRDRVDPYSANYKTTALPAASEITDAITITKSDLTINHTDYAEKLVVLGYDQTTGGTLITATSTELTTGAFSLKFQTGTIIRRVEIRKTDNTLVETITGEWPLATAVTTPFFTPSGGNLYGPSQVSIATATEGATIFYSKDANTGPWTEYTAPIELTETTTLWAYATKADLDDSNVATATFTFPTITDVATIADLRAGATDGTFYRLTGEAVLTAKDAFNNRKFITDTSGAIMIFDAAGKITTNYAIGNGIKNIVGTLTLSNEMLRFIPVQDPGAASSVTNAIESSVKEMDAIVSADQAKLVTLDNVTFGVTGNFATGQNYTLSSGDNTFILRTDFFGADYIGTAIPEEAVAITGVIIQFNAVMQIVPRNLLDFAYYHEVTFNVDMQYADTFVPATDMVYLTGSLFGWADPGTQEENQKMLPSATDPMVYTKTLTLKGGDYKYKYFINAGLGNGEWDGGSDREVTISEDKTIDDVFGRIGNEHGYMVTINVVDVDEAPITDAVITLNGEAYVAGSYFVPGTYAYTVTKSGFHTVTGDAVVVDDHITIEVEMVDESVSVNPDTKIANMKLYPNPANSILNFVSDEMISEVRVIDMLGNVVHSSSPESQHYVLNVNSFRAGMYLIQVNTPLGVSTHRVMIQK